MSAEFVFNGVAVLHLLLVVGGILGCFAVAFAVVIMVTRVVERGCRRDHWYDADGRRIDDV